MPDLLQQLEGFIREQRSASSAEEESAWRQRIEAKLETLGKREPSRSKRELLEELAADDVFMAELEAELAAEADELDDDDESDDDDGDDGDGDDDEDGDEGEGDGAEEGPRFRRVVLDVPRIYGGEDEPDHVEYLDEEGRVAVRPGRKRGRPVSEEWEEVDEDETLEATDEGEDDDERDE